MCFIEGGQHYHSSSDNTLLIEPKLFVFWEYKFSNKNFSSWPDCLYKQGREDGRQFRSRKLGWIVYNF